MKSSEFFIQDLRDQILHFKESEDILEEETADLRYHEQLGAQLETRNTKIATHAEVIENKVNIEKDYELRKVRSNLSKVGRG